MQGLNGMAEWRGGGNDQPFSCNKDCKLCLGIFMTFASYRLSISTAEVPFVMIAGINYALWWDCFASYDGNMNFVGLVFICSERFVDLGNLTLVSV